MIPEPMIPELGHFALIIAFGIAIVQSVVPLVGAAKNDYRVCGTDPCIYCQ
jgi:cytochrome c biogenesis factor